MSFHVPNHFRIRQGPAGSTEADGNNGAFQFSRGKVCKYLIVASDGEGWEHISVSMLGQKRCPTWAEMCMIKNIFWDDEDWVVQYHPARSEYVNVCETCLHLWRPTTVALPTPPKWMVG